MSLITELWYWLFGRPQPVPTAPPDWPTTMLQAINAQRQKVGARALTPHPILYRTANAHAAWMDLNHRLTHLEGAVGSEQRLRAAGYDWQYEGECCDYCLGTPEEVVGRWLADARHRAILLDPDYVEVGLGWAGGYWCADLGTIWMGRPHAQ